MSVFVVLVRSSLCKARDLIEFYLRIMLLAHISVSMVRPRAYFLLSFCDYFTLLGLKNECHFEFSNFS